MRSLLALIALALAFAAAAQVPPARTHRGPAPAKHAPDAGDDDDEEDRA